MEWRGVESAARTGAARHGQAKRLGRARRGVRRGGGDQTLQAGPGRAQHTRGHSQRFSTRGPTRQGTGRHLTIPL